jgi:NAD(P)-dependent dehydrogenase (short-subunit alcohol dehydrogenase family)
MSDLAGKVAIVTGASSGIGKKTAELLAAHGARVVTFARSAGDVRGDVADPEAIGRLFKETEARYGPCEILVNNAGMIDVAPLVETDLARWRRMFAVNVESVYLTCRRALPSMLERGAGAIVNVASISGVIGPEKFPGWVSYCAAKGAVISLTEALAVEVNAVSPGSVDTPMWAEASGGAPAAMTPEEIAETILFLASDRSRPMNGQNLNVYSS